MPILFFILDLNPNLDLNLDLNFLISDMSEKKATTNDETERFMETFDFESHWKQLEETIAANAAQANTSSNAASTAGKVESSQDAATAVANTGSDKPQVSETSQKQTECQSEYTRTNTRPVLHPTRRKSHHQQESSTNQSDPTKTTPAKPTKTLLLDSLPTETETAKQSKSKKRNSNVPEASASDSEQTASSGAASVSTSGANCLNTSGGNLVQGQNDHHQSAYHQFNIKFKHPFPTKSVLTLSESQQFSRLLSMRWQNAVAIANMIRSNVSGSSNEGNSGATWQERCELGPDVTVDDLRIYRRLKQAVRREQTHFQNYAEQAHRQFPDLTCTLSEEDLNYFIGLQRTLSQRRSSYPDYYRTMDSVSMVPRYNGDIDCWATTSEEAKKLTIQLEQVVGFKGQRMLLNPAQLTLSSQISINLNAAHLAKNFPNTADSSGSYQLNWKPRPISEDVLAKQYARRFDCHLALSCGSLKRILLDSGCESGWELPAMMDEPYDEFKVGNGQWLLCIDSTLPHQSGDGVSAADVQAKLANMRARIKFTKAIKQNKRKQQQQVDEATPPVKKQKMADSSTGAFEEYGVGEDLAALETFGGPADYIDSEGCSDEDLSASRQPDKSKPAPAAPTGPALIYSVLIIGRHRLLVRSRRPLVLLNHFVQKLFATAGRGFAPRPSAADAFGCQQLAGGNENNRMPCHLRVRLERQPYFGCEVPSAVEACRDWLACLATGNNASLLRMRCNVFDGRVLMYEFLSPQDLAKEAASSAILLPGLTAFNNLANGIERLRGTVGGFPAGVRLLLRRSPGDPACRLMLSEASCREHSLSMPPTAPSMRALPSPAWRPIGADLLSQPHWRDKRVPALFDPRIVSQADQQGIRHGAINKNQQQQQPARSDRGAHRGGRWNHRGVRGGGRGGQGGRGGGGGPTIRVKDPQSKKSTKAARWLERIRGGGGSRKPAGTSGRGRVAAAAAAAKWIRASSPAPEGDGDK